jgi:hypothetical protein
MRSWEFLNHSSVFLFPCPFELDCQGRLFLGIVGGDIENRAAFISRRWSEAQRQGTRCVSGKGRARAGIWEYNREIPRVVTSDRYSADDEISDSLIRNGECLV